MKKICVLGLGYIGLPTASMFASHGAQVVGVDVNSQIVEILNQGNIHIEEAGLYSLVRGAIASGFLKVKNTPEPADVFIVAVPTPFHADKTADMRAVTAATEAIVPHLRPGNLVVLESTSPPRTTVDLMKPILEKSGLTAGRDFMLAYSPERVLPGQILKELVANARVIGGIDRTSAEAGRDLYASFVKGEIVVTDATTAEMVKLMENTYRDVNIAIANEFALIAEHLGIDVWEAIEIANRHPRVKILRPGPGVGGHCIAIDPWFLVEAAPEQARLIRQARLVNDSMPGHVIQRTQELLKGIEQPSIACLGLTFKPDIDDVRESPAAEIALKLLELGYHVRAYDPFVRDFRPLGACLADSVETAVLDVDLILLLVDHAQFKALQPQDLDGIRRRQIFDTRNCFDSARWGSAGFDLVQLGHGTS